MAIAPSSDETKEKLKRARASQAQEPEYTFQPTHDKKYIYIHNGKISKPYSVDVLRFMEKNPGLPEPIRDMARSALESLGAEHKETETEIFSDTVTHIEGLPVYQDLMHRRFYVMIDGEPIYRVQLSELEKAIKARR